MRYMDAAKRRPLVVGLTTLALAGIGLAMPTSAAPAPSGTDVTLTSGTTMQSTWDISNGDGTDNGLPAGGNCSGAGLGVDDATYDVNNADNGDAFDQGLMFFVNDHQVVAPTTWDVQADASDNTLNRVLTAGPVAVGGVNATVEYRALPTQQVLRSTVFLSNPGASAVTVPFTVATNFGSDSGTGVRGTSSGDAALGNTDRWIVTSDDPTTPSDPVNTSVLAGPGDVAAPPVSTSGTVFDCSGTEGVEATYNVTIPAGATRGLMFLNELSATNEAATAAAARFNQNPGTADELLTGLSDAQRASILNWRLTTGQPDAVIRKPHSRFVGDNVYNTTGRQQTARNKAHRKGVRNFLVRVYDDGTGDATFAIHGAQSAHGVKVRYFSGSKNVTAAMKSSAGLTISPSAGMFQRIRVEITVRRHAAIGAHKYAKVISTWTGSGSVHTDVVRAIVRVVK